MGVIPLRGSIGNITFCNTQDGIIVKKKSQVDGKLIATDPRFERRRETMKEFATAAKAVRLLRAVLQPVLQKTADNRVTARLARAFIQVIQTDTINVRGKRTVPDGNMALLQGFEFNIKSSLGTVFFPPYTTTINRATGACTIDIPAFVPVNMIAAPKGATHFNLFCAGASIDFIHEEYVVDTKNADSIAINDVMIAASSLSVAVTANSPHPLLLVLGIAFSQEVNGVKYPLFNGAFNAMAVVNVEM